MFNDLEMAPPDPILGLSSAFREDPNPEKINLGVGVYKDESGQTPIPESVKTAERRLLESEASKSYLPIEGAAEYGASVRELLFGADHEVIADGRATTVQAPGGTGALRIAGDFLRHVCPGARIWMSEPTWSNHFNIFGAAGRFDRAEERGGRLARRQRCGLDEVHQRKQLVRDAASGRLGHA